MSSYWLPPSHHRVHHGSNPQYIDKNYGSTFIIWDRIFGTFEPEVEPAIYGITKPLAKPYNPVYLVFHEWQDLIRDVRKSKTLKEAWKILFGPPGGEEETDLSAPTRTITTPTKPEVSGA